jgi:hypothetical protein
MPLLDLQGWGKAPITNYAGRKGTQPFRTSGGRAASVFVIVFAANLMEEEPPHDLAQPPIPRDLDFAQAQLAYSIIESLLEHTRVVSDLIALMAQTLDEDTTKALTLTPVWTAYLDSRRSMERTRADVERFAEAMKSLSDEPNDKTN